MWFSELLSANGDKDSGLLHWTCGKRWWWSHWKHCSRCKFFFRWLW